jgi:WD40 repeat protein
LHNGTVRVLEADTNTAKRPPIDLKLGNGVIVTAAAFSVDGRRVLVAFAKEKGLVDPGMRLCDLTPQAKELGPVGKLRHPVNHVAISPDGHRALLGDNQGTVHLWDLDNGLPLNTFPLAAEAKAQPHTHAVAFFPRSPLVAAAGEEHFVRLWDMDTKKFGRFFLGNPGERFHCLAGSPDGRWIALGSTDKNKPLRLWNPKKGGMTDLSGHSGPVNALAFSTDGHRLLSVSADGTVRLWDLTTMQGKSLSSEPIKGRNPCAAFAPDGRRAVSSAGVVVRLWGLPK